MRKRVLIMGAAGRDFHNFNTVFRDDPSCLVVAFTAAQIPFIEKRTYPPALSGPLYPNGIPIHPEERLPDLIRDEKIDTVVFSYSDVDNDYIMRRAALCASLNADFVLLGAEKTMLRSHLPVISVTAVRTGCGKSAVTRYIAGVLKSEGKKAVAVRHPMPYGDLEKQRAQRFAGREDLKEAGCTIEEMEEYEPLIDAGVVVFSGVDYKEILKMAEKEAGVILWDGGNNDTPFIKPDLSIVVADPLRPGHELKYYHGEVNMITADLAVINKVNTASVEEIETVRNNIRSLNPGVRVVKTASAVTVQGDIKGKRVLVIEDGPTLTHGGMRYGAGIIAARAYGALPLDPRPYASGTIKKTFSAYPELKEILPAMGYSVAQIKELEETINAVPADSVLIATPIDLGRLIKINKPAVRVLYGIEEVESPGLKEAIKDFLKGL
jgi:predicted GTPase